MKNKKTIELTVLFLFFLLTAFFTGIHDAASKEKKVPASKVKTVEVNAWDCAACHKDKKVLPDNHVPTKEMPYDGCRVCHLPGEGNAVVLKSKIPGSHLHTLRGVTCLKCHGKTKNPEALDMSQCVACHGSTEKLAEKTKDVKPKNPHTSPHYGTELDCNLCHHQHTKSENYCAQCHQFDFVVP